MKGTHMSVRDLIYRDLSCCLPLFITILPLPQALLFNTIALSSRRSVAFCLSAHACLSVRRCLSPPFIQSCHLYVRPPQTNLPSLERFISRFKCKRNDDKRVLFHVWISSPPPPFLLEAGAPSSVSGNVTKALKIRGADELLVACFTFCLCKRTKLGETRKL